MKKTLLTIFALVIALVLPLTVFADKKEEKETEAKEPINVYLFWGNGCGYCEAAKQFFASIEEDYGEKFNLVEYEVWYNKDNKKLEENVADYFGDDVTGVPYIIIGDKTYGGYSSEYDEDLIDTIEKAYEDEDYVDEVAKVISGEIEPAKNYDTLIVIGIFVVIIGGFGALIYFSRK